MNAHVPANKANTAMVIVVEVVDFFDFAESSVARLIGASRTVVAVIMLH